jgi:hypothetical protein
MADSTPLGDEVRRLHARVQAEEAYRRDVLTHLGRCLPCWEHLALLLDRLAGLSPATPEAEMDGLADELTDRLAALHAEMAAARLSYEPDPEYLRPHRPPEPSWSALRDGERAGYELNERLHDLRQQLLCADPGDRPSLLRLVRQCVAEPLLRATLGIVVAQLGRAIPEPVVLPPVPELSPTPTPADVQSAAPPAALTAPSPSPNPGPNDPPEPALTARRRRILAELHRRLAFSEEARVKTAAIAEAIDPQSSVGSFKNDMLFLKSLGYVDSSLGRKGGCWLTVAGQARAAAGGV